MSVRVFAPAKINLTLEVGRARADGRHPLQSVVAFADIGDWVEAAPGEALSLQIEGPCAGGLGAGEDNLVMRAARLLADAASLPAPRAALRLQKNLPLASGIGGGSSDAAAALKALNALWRLGFSDARLSALAGALGADAPVCVFARPAYMTGVGADFSALEAPAFACVLANPMRPLPTGEVYRQFDAMGLGGGFTPRPAPRWENAAAALAAIAQAGNDLTAPACALAPEIESLLSMLRQDGRVLHAALSGSGATVFGLTESASEAAEIAAELGRRQPNYWVRAARLGRP